MYEKYVPDGVEDCLPGECYIKKNIENSLRKEFVLSGYDEIETPAYEYYDVFQSGVGSYIQESMIKFIDPKGRIIVLRPDITVPIARVAATKLGEGVKRLFYIQDSFAAAQPSIGRAGEFTQAGVELIGDGSIYADAEVISLAVKSLLLSGLSNFTIDIGQVDFFKALIGNLNLSEDGTDELRRAVDSKDIMAINSVADKFNIDNCLKQKILALPDLFGGEEIFEKALKLSGGYESRKAVNNLKEVYELLSFFGLKKYISIDFGMLHDIAYYSGIIFRGITPMLGFPVVSGGRYDGLIERFGAPAPATGFALGIKRVMIAMERQGLLGGYYDTYAVVSCDKEQYITAFEYVSKLKSEGKRVIFLVGLDKEELKSIKTKNNAEIAIYIDKEGNKENL